MKKIKGFLLSVGVTAAASLVVFGIAALVIAKTGNLPQQPLLAVLVTLFSCCTVFLGGLAASLFTKKKALLEAELVVCSLLAVSWPAQWGL